MNTTAPQAAHQSLSSPRFVAGLLGLTISMSASAALVAKHLHLFSAPGCGAGSACDKAAESIFGSVPFVGWPLSHFGLAWFSVLLVAWVASFRGTLISGQLRNLVRLGAAGSLVYIGAMLIGGYLCPYCLAVHAGNFLFLLSEAGARRTRGPLLAFAPSAALVFGLVTGALVSAEAWQLRIAEQERLQSTQSIIEATGTPPVIQGEPFIGRYPRGPEQAPIRIVSFIDYACGACKKIEEQAERILSSRDDVMLSVKHFPLCTDCNAFVPDNMHPTSCRAAIAAETAGLLGGSDAFWAISRWLFERKGAFTNGQLRGYVAQSGLDVEAFFATLESEEPKRRVQADTEEADLLGVFGTPVVYINGGELKGFHGDDGLVQAVEDLGAAGLPARDASADQPIGAIERHIAAWRSGTAADIRPGQHSWTLGPEDASGEEAQIIEVVLFADYLIPSTVQADALVRELVARRTDVQYSFRHFPLSAGCNPISKRTIHQFSCPAHYAAEAAGRLYGEHGYWSMHDWILSHQVEIDVAAIDVAAAELGFDVDVIRDGLNDPVILQAIEFDSREAARVRAFASPSIVIAGRLVPNWRQPGILDLIVDEARDNPPAPGTAVDAHHGHSHGESPPLASTKFAEGLVVGPANARAELALWGDLQSVETADADRTLQEVFGRRNDVSYRFRHFPMDASCNPKVESTLNHQACLASRALEAAGKTGGIVGYWRMLAWLMNHQRGLDRAALLGAAASTDLVTEDFLAWLDHAEVHSLIDTDLAEASELGVREAPTVFLNGQLVPNWRDPGVIDRMIEKLEK